VKVEEKKTNSFRDGGIQVVESMVPNAPFKTLNMSFRCMESVILHFAVLLTILLCSAFHLIIMCNNIINKPRKRGKHIIKNDDEKSVTQRDEHNNIYIYRGYISGILCKYRRF
jgi:hypothetical protein